MKACHTGYRKASGWYLPVGKLASKGIIDFSDYAEEAANHSPPVRVDAETVEQFWDDNVCAPGTTANGPTVAGNLYGVVDGGGLCKLCKTDCTSSDPYAGYEGALSCMDQEGDIAFVKHSTVRNYDASDSEDDDSDDDDDGDDDDGDDDGDDDDGDDDGDDDDGDDDDGDDGSDRPPLTESDKSNYVGICDAGCMTLFNADGTPIQGSDGQFRYEKCSTGKLSSDAMVAKKSFVGSPEYNILMDALSLSNNTSAAVDAGDITEQQATALKQEGTVGLWSANTQLLYKITEPTTDSGFQSFFTAYDAFKEIQFSEISDKGGGFG
ncbi:hypothetical protein DUNSADRAFT_8246 [Dunaliella salina]|uniref:Transferrin-like domain-containing protein n=1 Tax=Dunaliella salina TaxID=3046 RepID=A0ABQ7HA52_DUNSA|nr:hypothetical protein DUNSADRAFT_8246 [Dunaliella salina]|eukprot:KAF5843732.1 hypothetical protein DUNSADRAFT_8246 [Dunaliella salina]